MIHKHSSRRFRYAKRHGSAVLLSLCAWVACSILAWGALDGTGLTPEQERELAFVDALLDARLPDYAAIILERMDLPAEIMAMREIRSFTARGEFDAARAIADATPGDTQEGMTLRLALADGYYAWGRYDEAREIYEAFFAAFPAKPDDSIKPFYMSSAYRYAQMMILTGNRTAAAEAYRMALRAEPERHIERQLQGELAELLVLKARDATGAARDRYLAEVQQLANNILWVQDLWFGRAVVLLAHIRVMQGDIDGAMLLVDDYTSQLRAIDQSLREQSAEFGEDLTRLSPMAQARHLIGEILHDRALEILAEGGNRDEALELLIGRRTAGGRQVSGAVQHFLNVFIRYPNTSWAPHAGNRFRQVEQLLDREFGRQVQAQVTREQWEEVERAQFREARALFNQSRFSEASENYLQVLNLFPEQATSIPAFGELAASFIEQDDFVLADAVARHLAERFNQHEEFSTEAGNQVIRIANKYQEINQPERYRDTYQVFFAHFARHPRTLLDLQRFARDALSAENFDLAMEYYTQIATRFRGRSAYFDALSNMARIFREQGDTLRKAQVLRRAVAEMTEANVRSHLRVNLTYRLANAMREMGSEHVDRAQVLFRQVREMLEGDQAAAFAANDREVAANARLLQGALFFSAIADAMRTTVPENIQQAFNQRVGAEVPPERILNDFKVRAIRQLDDLVSRFPESPFAPAALSQIGTLNTFLGRSDDAAAALRRLERDYPDSPEAANAVFQIGRNLLDLGMREDAVVYFSRMFEGDAAFPVPQILTAGQELLDAEEYQIALTAFERVIAASDERRYVESARVGKGQALFGLRRYQDAAEWFEQVIADYPQSGLTITISRTASEANAAWASQTDDGENRRALFNRSVELMRRALQFAQEPGVQAQIEVAVARILERRSESEERFGSAARASDFQREAVGAYQTLMMFRDASDPSVAPHIQTAYSRAVPLMIAMQRWQDVFDDARGYLEKFPNGRYAGAMRSAITTARTQGDITE